MVYWNNLLQPPCFAFEVRTHREMNPLVRVLEPCHSRTRTTHPDSWGLGAIPQLYSSPTSRGISSHWHLLIWSLKDNFWCNLKGDMHFVMSFLRLNLGPSIRVRSTFTPTQSWLISQCNSPALSWLVVHTSILLSQHSQDLDLIHCSHQHCTGSHSHKIVLSLFTPTQSWLISQLNSPVLSWLIVRTSILLSQHHTRSSRLILHISITLRVIHIRLRWVIVHTRLCWAIILHTWVHSTLTKPDGPGTTLCPTEGKWQRRKQIVL